MVAVFSYKMITMVTSYTNFDEGTKTLPIGTFL